MHAHINQYITYSLAKLSKVSTPEPEVLRSLHCDSKPCFVTKCQLIQWPYRIHIYILPDHRTFCTQNIGHCIHCKY